MILKHKAELAGRVKLQISGGERGTIDYPWFNNMILDQGLVKLLSTGGAVTNMAFRFFSVGSSSSPVTATQTGLISPIARISGTTPPVTDHGWDADGGFGWSRSSKSFPRGAAAGNISELSTSNEDNNSSALARTLVRDASGNPTTITVLSDEVLTVTWEFRRWWLVKPGHLVEYDDGDGNTLSTTVSYTTIEQLGKGPNELGNGGVSGFRGELLTPNTARVSRFFAEGSGNPSIASVPSGLNYAGSIFPTDSAYSSFSPAIPKTNAFTCEIFTELTLSRREP